MESNGERWSQELRGDIPRSYQRHGDLVLLGDGCFSLPLWKKMGIVLKHYHTFLLLSAKNRDGSEFSVLEFPPQSPDLNPVENHWDVLEEEMCSMIVKVTDLQKLYDAIMSP